jgi:hypothetical protein
MGESRPPSTRPRFCSEKWRAATRHLVTKPRQESARQTSAETAAATEPRGTGRSGSSPVQRLAILRTYRRSSLGALSTGRSLSGVSALSTPA